MLTHSILFSTPLPQFLATPLVLDACDEHLLEDGDVKLGLYCSCSECISIPIHVVVSTPFFNDCGKKRSRDRDAVSAVCTVVVSLYTSLSSVPRRGVR